MKWFDSGFNNNKIVLNIISENWDKINTEKIDSKKSFLKEKFMLVKRNKEKELNDSY